MEIQNKYANGKIYKISSPSTVNVYIGSTCKTLNERLSQHKCDYKRYKNGKYHYVTSFEIVKFDDCVINLIEEIKTNSLDLIDQETYHINNETNAVNKYTPKSSNEEEIRFCNICNCYTTTKHESRHDNTLKHRDNVKNRLINLDINDASKTIFKRAYTLIQKQKLELEQLEQEYEKYLMS